MTSWDRLLDIGQRGLAVEGNDDKQVIESFLDAGERAGHWSDWRSHLKVEVAITQKRGTKAVLDDVIEWPGRVFGLIDRDWRSEVELDKLRADHANLLILPRIMIENYLIDPTELQSLLAYNQHITDEQFADLTARIIASLDDWVQHGALWQVMYRHGADDFCHPTRGFHGVFRNRPLTNTQMIKQQLNKFKKNA